MSTTSSGSSVAGSPEGSDSRWREVLFFLLFGLAVLALQSVALFPRVPWQRTIVDVRRSPRGFSDFFETAWQGNADTPAELMELRADLWSVSLADFCDKTEGEQWLVDFWRTNDLAKTCRTNLAAMSEEINNHSPGASSVDSSGLHIHLAAREGPHCTGKNWDLDIVDCDRLAELDDLSKQTKFAMFAAMGLTLVATIIAMTPAIHGKGCCRRACYIIVTVLYVLGIGLCVAATVWYAIGQRGANVSQVIGDENMNNLLYYIMPAGDRVKMASATQETYEQVISTMVLSQGARQRAFSLLVDQSGQAVKETTQLQADSEPLLGEEGSLKQAKGSIGFDGEEVDSDEETQKLEQWRRDAHPTKPLSQIEQFGKELLQACTWEPNRPTSAVPQRCSATAPSSRALVVHAAGEASTAVALVAESRDLSEGTVVAARDATKQVQLALDNAKTQGVKAVVDIVQLLAASGRLAADLIAASAKATEAFAKFQDLATSASALVSAFEARNWLALAMALFSFVKTLLVNLPVIFGDIRDMLRPLMTSLPAFIAAVVNTSKAISATLSALWKVAQAIAPETTDRLASYAKRLHSKVSGFLGRLTAPFLGPQRRNFTDLEGCAQAASDIFKLSQRTLLASDGTITKGMGTEVAVSTGETAKDIIEVIERLRIAVEDVLSSFARQGAAANPPISRRLEAWRLTPQASDSVNGTVVAMLQDLKVQATGAIAIVRAAPAQLQLRARRCWEIAREEWTSLGQSVKWNDAPDPSRLIRALNIIGDAFNKLVGSKATTFVGVLEDVRTMAGQVLQSLLELTDLVSQAVRFAPRWSFGKAVGRVTACLSDILATAEVVVGQATTTSTSLREHVEELAQSPDNEVAALAAAFSTGLRGIASSVMSCGNGDQEEACYPDVYLRLTVQRLLVPVRKFRDQVLGKAGRWAGAIDNEMQTKVLPVLDRIDSTSATVRSQVLAPLLSAVQGTSDFTTLLSAGVKNFTEQFKAKMARYSPELVWPQLVANATSKGEEAAAAIGEGVQTFLSEVGPLILQLRMLASSASAQLSQPRLRLAERRLAGGDGINTVEGPEAAVLEQVSRRVLGVAEALEGSFASMKASEACLRTAAQQATDALNSSALRANGAAQLRTLGAVLSAIQQRGEGIGKRWQTQKSVILGGDVKAAITFGREASVGLLADLANGIATVRYVVEAAQEISERLQAAAIGAVECSGAALAGVESGLHAVSRALQALKELQRRLDAGSAPPTLAEAIRSLESISTAYGAKVAAGLQTFSDEVAGLAARWSASKRSPADALGDLSDGLQAMHDVVLATLGGVNYFGDLAGQLSKQGATAWPSLVTLLDGSAKSLSGANETLGQEALDLKGLLDLRSAVGERIDVNAVLAALDGDAGLSSTTASTRPEGLLAFNAALVALEGSVRRAWARGAACLETSAEALATVPALPDITKISLPIKEVVANLTEVAKTGELARLVEAVRRALPRLMRLKSDTLVAVLATGQQAADLVAWEAQQLSACAAGAKEGVDAALLEVAKGYVALHTDANLQVADIQGFLERQLLNESSSGALVAQQLQVAADVLDRIAQGVRIGVGKVADASREIGAASTWAMSLLGMLAKPEDLLGWLRKELERSLALANGTESALAGTAQGLQEEVDEELAKVADAHPGLAGLQDFEGGLEAVWLLAQDAAQVVEDLGSDTTSPVRQKALALQSSAANAQQLLLAKASSCSVLLFEQTFGDASRLARVGEALPAVGIGAAAGAVGVELALTDAWEQAKALAAPLHEKAIRLAGRAAGFAQRLQALQAAALACRHDVESTADAALTEVASAAADFTAAAAAAGLNSRAASDIQEHAPAAVQHARDAVKGLLDVLGSIFVPLAKAAAAARSVSATASAHARRLAEAVPALPPLAWGRTIGEEGGGFLTLVSQAIVKVSDGVNFVGRLMSGAAQLGSLVEKGLLMLNQSGMFGERMGSLLQRLTQSLNWWGGTDQQVRRLAGVLDSTPLLLPPDELEGEPAELASQCSLPASCVGEFEYNGSAVRGCTSLDPNEVGEEDGDRFGVWCSLDEVYRGRRAHCLCTRALVLSATACRNCMKATAVLDTSSREASDRIDRDSTRAVNVALRTYGLNPSVRPKEAFHSGAIGWYCILSSGVLLAIVGKYLIFFRAETGICHRRSPVEKRRLTERFPDGVELVPSTRRATARQSHVAFADVVLAAERAHESGRDSGQQPQGAGRQSNFVEHPVVFNHGAAPQGQSSGSSDPRSSRRAPPPRPSARCGAPQQEDPSRGGGLDPAAGRQHRPSAHQGTQDFAGGGVSPVATWQQRPSMLQAQGLTRGGGGDPIATWQQRPSMRQGPQSLGFGLDASATWQQPQQLQQRPSVHQAPGHRHQSVGFVQGFALSPDDLEVYGGVVQGAALDLEQPASRRSAQLPPQVGQFGLSPRPSMAGGQSVARRPDKLVDPFAYAMS